MYILSDSFPKTSQRKKEILELIKTNDFENKVKKICESYNHFINEIKK